MRLNFPSINQIITIAIAMAIVFFALKMMPESVKSIFRV